jgi:hypothetical protein
MGDRRAPAIVYAVESWPCCPRRRNGGNWRWQLRVQSGCRYRRVCSRGHRCSCGHQCRRVCSRGHRCSCGHRRRSGCCRCRCRDCRSSCRCRLRHRCRCSSRPSRKRSHCALDARSRVWRPVRRTLRTLTIAIAAKSGRNQLRIRSLRRAAELDGAWCRLRVRRRGIRIAELALDAGGRIPGC